MSSPKRLTFRVEKFIAEYLAGKSAEQAALAAGFPKKSARARGYELLNHNTAVIAAVAEGREKIRQQANFDATKAMQEFDQAIAFAKETKNATAYARCIELKAKLAGLLTEKKESNNASFRINILGLDTPVPSIIAVKE